MKRKGLPEEQRLTVKEQKFVQAIVSGGASGPSEAVAMSGSLAQPKYHAKLGQAIIARPHIQNALAKAIRDEFPDVAGKGARLLNQILDDPDASYATKLKGLETLIKIFGWQAPAKVQHEGSHKNDVIDLPTDGSDDDAKG